MSGEENYGQVVKTGQIEAHLYLHGIYSWFLTSVAMVYELKVIQGQNVMLFDWC